MLPQRRGPNARVRRGTARRKSARGDDQGIADEMNELCEPEGTRGTASCARISPVTHRIPHLSTLAARHCKRRRIAWRLADSVAGHAPRARRAGDSGGCGPGAPDLDQHAGERVRRSHRQQYAPRDPEWAAGRDAGHRGPSAGAGGRGYGESRTVWMEESARQPGIIRCRRLPQRNGHHQSVAPRGEHVERRLACDRFRPGGRPRGRRQGHYWHSPTSCGRRKPRRAGPSTRR